MNDMEKTFDGIDDVIVYRCYENLWKTNMSVWDICQ